MSKQKSENKDEDSPKLEKSLPDIKKMKVVDYLITSLSSEPSSLEFEENSKKIGNTYFKINGRILIPIEKYLTGKDTNSRWIYKWTNKAPHPLEQPARLKVPYLSGTIGDARNVETELAAFNIYVTENMLEKILLHTNEAIKISQYYGLPTKNCAYPLSKVELKAFMGILFLTAAKKYGEVTKSFLFGESDIYNTIISRGRFEHLVQCLRFDKDTERDIKNNIDPLFGIRNIWETFITKCSEVFRPSTDCIIDELLVDYIGICEFMLPVPKEPQKSLLKLILLCDSTNRYLMSGALHIDENNNNSLLAEHVIENLTKPIHGTNINITYGSDCYTSVKLAKKMWKYYKLTTIGTLNKCQSEIPEDVVITENRIVGSSIFLYNIRDELQLCTYYPAHGETKVLLSNIHFESAIKEPHGQPNVFEYCNTIKNRIDIIKNIYYGYGCSRPTSKSFLAIFYTILDLASVNSLAILNSNRSNCGKPSIRRGDFLYKLGLELIIPYITERIMEPNITDSMKNTIKNIMKEQIKTDLKRISNQQNIDIYLPNKLNTVMKPIGSERNDGKNQTFVSTVKQRPESPKHLKKPIQLPPSNIDKVLNQNNCLNSKKQTKQAAPSIPINYKMPQNNVMCLPLYQAIATQSAPPHLGMYWNTSNPLLQQRQALHVPSHLLSAFYSNQRVMPYNGTSIDRSTTRSIPTLQQIQVLKKHANSFQTAPKKY